MKSTAQPHATPLLHWPARSQLLEAIWLGLAFSLWFGLIYGGADLITGLRSTRVRLHLDAELAIPFVPAAAIAYMSVYPLFWLAPFVLRTRRELRALVAAMAVAVLIGGIGFLLVPAELAFPPRSTVAGPFASVFRVADGLNLRYNLAPSLHVALAVICADVYARQAAAFARALLWLWAALIAVSTLLIHQHHVVDVVTGFAVAMVVSRWLYPRWAASGAEQ